MCLFRRKRKKDPFDFEKKQMESEMIANSVQVGDRFLRRWNEVVGSTTLFVKAEYTVTRIEGDLITLEAPHEEALQLTRKEFAYDLCYFFTKVQ